MTRFLLSALLAVSVVAFVALSWLREERRPWVRYQERFQERAAEERVEERVRLGREEESALQRRIRRIAQGERGIVQFRNDEGQVERCLTCHLGLEEISGSHPVEEMGCVVCHGGDPLALEEKAAHRGLVGGGRGSDLRFAERTCGRSGFGRFKCHAGIVRSFDHPSVERCARCHYELSGSGRYEGGDVAMVDAPPGGRGKAHRLTIAIPSSVCLGCHKPPREEHKEAPPCVTKLSCVSCHSDEVMRSGEIGVSCDTCHRPRFERVSSEDDPVLRRSKPNPFVRCEVGDLLGLDLKGRKMPHLRRIGDRVILIDKATGVRFEVPVFEGGRGGGR